MFESVDLYRLLRFLAPAILPALALKFLWPSLDAKGLLVAGIVGSIMTGALVSTLVQGANTRTKRITRWFIDGGALTDVREFVAERLRDASQLPGFTLPTWSKDRLPEWARYKALRMVVSL